VWVIFIFFYVGTFLSTGNFGFERSSTFCEYLVRFFCFGSIIGSSIIFSVALKQTFQNVSLMEQAKREKMETCVNINLPESIYISDSDLCIVFWNLLENALEACKRQRASTPFITVSATLAGDYAVIAVDNSFDGDINKDKDIFLSSKRDGKGIGITSVQAVAEKYHGQTKFEFLDNVFRASVMLQVMDYTRLSELSF